MGEKVGFGVMASVIINRNSNLAIASILKKECRDRLGIPRFREIVVGEQTQTREATRRDVSTHAANMIRVA